MAAGKEYTKTILVHYFRTTWEALDKTWDSDHTTEIETAVDELFDDAVSQVKHDIADALGALATPK
jgi:hypothetical protein